MSETSSNSNNINYSKHINVSSPSQEITSNDQIFLLQKILAELRKATGDSLSIYHISYPINTLIITKQKIDIVSDTGSYATEMTVINKGGEFSIYINDESVSIKAHNGLKVINEKINQLYWIGSGTQGTGIIRLGLIQ